MILFVLRRQAHAAEVDQLQRFIGVSIRLYRYVDRGVLEPDQMNNLATGICGGVVVDGEEELYDHSDA